MGLEMKISKEREEETIIAEENIAFVHRKFIEVKRKARSSEAINLSIGFETIRSTSANRLDNNSKARVADSNLPHPSNDFCLELPRTRPTQDNLHLEKLYSFS